MIRRRPRALLDIIEQAEWIGNDSPAAAERFIAAVEKTLVFLEQSPHAGRSWPTANAKLGGLRVWAVDGFPNHLVFYRPVEGGIEMLLVLHGARDIDAIIEQE